MERFFLWFDRKGTANEDMTGAILETTFKF